MGVSPSLLFTWQCGWSKGLRKTPSVQPRPAQKSSLPAATGYEDHNVTPRPWNPPLAERPSGHSLIHYSSLLPGFVCVVLLLFVSQARMESHKTLDFLELSVNVEGCVQRNDRTNIEQAKNHARKREQSCSLRLYHTSQFAKRFHIDWVPTRLTANWSWGTWDPVQVAGRGILELRLWSLG